MLRAEVACGLGSRRSPRIDTSCRSVIGRPESSRQSFRPTGSMRSAHATGLLGGFTATLLASGKVLIVGYDSAAALKAAQSAGFGSIGELDVWVKTGITRRKGSRTSLSRMLLVPAFQMDTWTDVMLSESSGLPL